MGSVISSWAAAQSVTGTSLLDVTGLTGAVAAYSMARKLRAAYAGSCFRMRRSSDGAETDIGFVGNEVDTAAMEAFAPAQDGYVTAWYDQSSNGSHIFQSQHPQQPHCWGGAPELLGSHLCFLTSDQQYLLGTNLAGSQVTEATMSLITDESLVGGHMNFKGVGEGYIGCSTGYSTGGAGITSWVQGHGVVRSHDNPPPGGAGARYIQVAVLGQTAETFINRANGVTSTASLGGTPYLMDSILRSLTVGTDSYGVYFLGRTQELVIWSGALSLQSVADIEDNANIFYSIY